MSIRGSLCKRTKNIQNYKCISKVSTTKSFGWHEIVAFMASKQCATMLVQQVVELLSNLTVCKHIASTDALTSMFHFSILTLSGA